MRRLGRKKIIVIVAAAIVVVGVSVASVVMLRRPAPTANPFTTKTLASVKFPLYYPTQIPKGFHIDPKSVESPQEGVIVFSLVDSKGRKIYLSQELRVSTYDYGRFYNSIEQGQQFKAALGQAVVGHLSNRQTVVGSMVSEKTWVIINAKGDTATPTQLQSIINSLTASL
jgi:hypothetical protein